MNKRNVEKNFSIPFLFNTNSLLSALNLTIFFESFYATAIRRNSLKVYDFFEQSV